MMSCKTPQPHFCIIQIRRNVVLSYKKAAGLGFRARQTVFLWSALVRFAVGGEKIGLLFGDMFPISRIRCILTLLLFKNVNSAEKTKKCTDLPQNQSIVTFRAHRHQRLKFFAKFIKFFTFPVKCTMMCRC